MRTKIDTILDAIGEGAATASEIAAMTGIHRPLVSMHMANLTRAEMVTREVFGRCNGRPTYLYRLAELGSKRLACTMAEARLPLVEAAARKLFTVKGRYHSQIAMCELGELLGYPVVWPDKQEKVTP
jgi:predicted ArsR family transcriptional regulator